MGICFVGERQNFGGFVCEHMLSSLVCQNIRAD